MGAMASSSGVGAGRMGELVAPLATAAIGRQQPVYRAHRAEVATLVEQRGMHGRRGGADEAFAVEGVEQRLTLLGIERQRRRGSRTAALQGSDEAPRVASRSDAVPVRPAAGP